MPSRHDNPGAGSHRRAPLRDRLLRILDLARSRKLLVVGDFIADQFLYGQISRVSREAPVLVLQYRDLVCVPGGAANAANNLLDLGCRVKVFGVVGDDDPGRTLVEALTTKGADVSDVIRLKSYATPIKTRILAGAHHSAPQQIVRVDRISELNSEFNPPWKKLQESLSLGQGIILSDYGYGSVSSSLVDIARTVAKRKHIPLVVDSRFRMNEFKSVTSITPNITELESALDVRIGSDAQLLRTVGEQVVRKQKLDHLLITQGRFGMTLFQSGRAPIHIPIFGSDEVADVTGAGDTVIAVFTLALACQASPEDAARLANYAGGVVVMKRGTATATSAEICAAVKQDLA